MITGAYERGRAHGGGCSRSTRSIDDHGNRVEHGFLQLYGPCGRQSSSRGRQAVCAPSTRRRSSRRSAARSPGIKARVCRRSGRGDISSDRSPEVAASGTVTAGCPTRRPRCRGHPAAARLDRLANHGESRSQTDPVAFTARASRTSSCLASCWIRSPVVEPTVVKGFIGRLHRASLARVERWHTAPDRHRNEASASRCRSTRPDPIDSPEWAGFMASG